ncbi:MAG: ABC transporter substrate-binding protein [Gammaproteobacteria bacterium]
MPDLQSVWFATASLQFVNNIVLTNPNPFADEGFEVSAMDPGVGDRVVKALMDQRVEYCNVLGMPLIRAASGYPLKFVASFQNSGWELWTRPEITALKQLEGKTIGRTSPYPRERLNSALAAAGVDPDSVSEGPFIPLDAAGINSVVEGVVDGALIMAPVSSIAREAGLVSPYNLNLAGHSAAYGLMTTEQMLAENRDQVKRFLRATLRSSRELQTDRDLAYQLVARQGVAERFIDQALDSTLPYLNPTGELSETTQHRWIETAKTILGLDEKIPLQRVFDFSILAELAAED